MKKQQSRMVVMPTDLGLRFSVTGSDPRPIICLLKPHFLIYKTRMAMLSTQYILT